jgi:hypothetical protein
MLPLYLIDFVKTFHIDFVAFWCAGSASNAGLNPYLDASLHDCDVRFGLLPTLTMPIAHPPYVIPLFKALALLPEGPAFALWCVVTLGAWILTTRAACRLTGLDWLTVGAATAMLAIIPSLPLGQIVPVALCAFTWALVFVRDDRPAAAAAALAVTAMLPNFAEGAWIASFICMPRVRLPLLAAGIFLIALGAVAVGAPTMHLYFSAVLPAYGRSELTAFWQLGSAALLRVLGAGASQAFPIAYALLAGAIALGVYTGTKLRDRFGGNHWVPATVVTFGVIAAPYAHDTDVSFALPLALMLYAALPNSRLVRSAAFVVLVPWQHLIGDTGIQTAIVLPPMLIVAGALATTPALGAYVACAIELICMMLYRLAGSANAQLQAARSLPHGPLPPNALSEVRWTQLAQTAHSVPSAILFRAFDYVAVAAVLVAAFRAATAGRAQPRKPA